MYVKYYHSSFMTASAGSSVCRQIIGDAMIGEANAVQISAIVFSVLFVAAWKLN
jgi:hypothetical protein